MPKTLLLADDSVTIQKVVGITFANEDVDLVTVDNGDVALERAREIRPDLVLADVAMPGMSGYELCKAIKADSELAGTPVVLLTGTFETFDAQRAADVGSDGHITKPFEAQALIDCVNALLAATPESSRTDSRSSDLGMSPPLADDLAGAAQQRAPQDVPAESAPPPWDASPIQLDEVALEPQERVFGQPFEFSESPSGDVTQEATGPPDASKTERHEPSNAPPTEPSLESLGWNLEEALPATSKVSEEDMGNTAYLEPEPMSAGPAGADPNTSQQREYPMPEPEALTGNADAGVPASTRLPFHVPPDDPPTDSSLPGADALFDPTLRAQDLRGQSASLLDPVSEEMEPTVTASETATDMLPEAVANPAPEPQPAPPEETSRLEPEEPAGTATATPSGVTGKIDRDELRGALEKAAWEAFGSISEELVQQTVRRVEQIAWEIVPQLAERLVQEEIERLKDDKPPE